MNKRQKKLHLTRESVRALDRLDLREVEGGTDSGISICEVDPCIPTPKRTSIH